MESNISELPPDRPELYQCENQYNHYLPYSSQLDSESSEWLEEIKLNLSRAVLLRDIKPGVVTWLNRLTAYISLYGYKFTKEEHLEFIDLTWELLTIPELEHGLIHLFIRILIKLLRKPRLITPADLVLNWRTLYDIKQEIRNSKLVRTNMNFHEELQTDLNSLIKLCRLYFPPSSTEEILSVARPQFCPHDMAMDRAVHLCYLYLPTVFLERELEGNSWRRMVLPGYRAWLGEILTLWHSCSNNLPWEGNLFSLLARLAEDNIGMIDWEPELPFIFQKIMYSLDLPVYYKSLDPVLLCNLPTSSISSWIVSTITPTSSTLLHLDIMMNAINSYYHSTSEGIYSCTLVDFLFSIILAFGSRLNSERCEQKAHWIPATSSSLKITDDQVGEFCRIVKPAVMDLTMSESFVSAAAMMLRILSDIRPDMFLPDLISKLDSSLGTLTSPHKFTAAIKCLCSVSRIMVRPGELFPSAPDRIIDILFSVLPGIDCNDFEKTIICTELIGYFTILVPLCDLSAETSNKVCQETARFGLFVTEFMDRCFSLIESCSLENARQEISNSNIEMSGEECSISEGIVSSFNCVISQAEESIIDLVITKIESYLKGRIMEPFISGKMFSGMVRMCVENFPWKVLPALLPSVCSVLLSCLAEADLSSHRYLGDELMFHLLLLTDMLNCPGSILLPHISLLEQVLETALSSHNEEAHSLAREILFSLTSSLSQLCLIERSKIVSSPSPFPLQDWGKSSDLSKLDIKWFIPGQEEFEQVARLLDNFLDKEVVKLEKFLSGSLVLDKDELYRSLKTISSILIGCSGFLHNWSDEEPVSHVETVVENRPRDLMIGLPFDYKFRGENTRRALALLMASLVDKILQEREDDTKTLNAIIIILKNIVLNFSLSQEDYQELSNNFYNFKNKLVKLPGKEKYIRQILLSRVLLQHQKRLVENNSVSLSRTHSTIIRLLVRLATSHYSEVRIQAQGVLQQIQTKYPDSSHYVVSQVTPLLSSGLEVSHQQLKGALHVLLSNRLLLIDDLSITVDLWPALLRCRHSGKPSITGLLRDLADQIVQLDKEPWPLHLTKTTHRLGSAARKICYDSPSKEEVAEREDRLLSKAQRKVELYSNLVDRLCDMAGREEESIHWIYYEITLDMLHVLLRRDIAFPGRAVSIFTNNLIHDNINVRRRSVLVLQGILKQNKRKHPKVKLPNRQLKEGFIETNNNSLDVNENKIDLTQNLLVKPGERSDNNWLQYSSSNRPVDQKSYDEPRYLHKSCYGFYTWPEEDLVYAPSSEQPQLDREEEEMPESERIIFRFFKVESNVNKFVDFLSLENKKGQDHFGADRFGMFKALFRNFGDSVLGLFRGHIERLVGDHRESHQRAAAELMAGLVRGSKHWTYSKVESLWSWLLPAVRQALTLMSPETIRDWGTSFATSSYNRDPNRIHWLMEVAMEEPIRSQGSFIDSSRLYMLQGLVIQQSWRVGELFSRLLVFLRPFLDHPYYNVRCRLGSVLTSIFSLDLQCEAEHNANVSSPFEREFVKEILPSLDCLREESTQVITQDQKDSALRLLQTLSMWISCSTASSLGPVKVETLSFLPFLLGYEWYDKDPQLARDCQIALSCLSRTAHPPGNIKTLIEILSKTLNSQSWKTRLSSLDFLQAVIFNNFIMFLSPTVKRNDSLRRNVISLVMECLKDMQVEVRVKAAQVLGGMIHCQFVSPGENQGIIDQFQESLEVEDSLQAVHRHGAILGLCSVVTAFPHTVPPLVPPLLLYLGRFLHHKQPIPATIEQTVQSWKRTHQDNWSQHREAFTEDQLEEMTNLLVSPSYYA